MTEMDEETWRRLGRRDYLAGAPFAAAPSAEGTMAGDAWRAGWLAAKDEDTESKAPAYEMLDVRLELRDGRLLLTDARGRVVGSQTSVIVEQGEETMASVTFAGLQIFTP